MVAHNNFVGIPNDCSRANPRFSAQSSFGDSLAVHSVFISAVSMGITCIAASMAGYVLPKSVFTAVQ